MSMTPDEYVKGVLATESNDIPSIQGRLDQHGIRLLHAAMGMQTESAEFTDMLKKHLFYGKPLDKINLIEEIGDQLWYIALALDELGSSFGTAMELNNKKLMARYAAKKKFTETEAANRDLEKERKILEGK